MPVLTICTSEPALFLLFETFLQRCRVGRILQGTAAHGERLVGNGERPAVASQRRLDGALPERQRTPLCRQRRQFRQGRRAVGAPRRQKSGLLSGTPCWYWSLFCRSVRFTCFLSMKEQPVDAVFGGEPRRNVSIDLEGAFDEKVGS